MIQLSTFVQNSGHSKTYVSQSVSLVSKTRQMLKPKKTTLRILIIKCKV